MTEDELKMWQLKYPGSEDEKEDLIKYYKLRQGSMSLVTESIPFCEREDLYRVKQVVDQLIADGLLEVRIVYLVERSVCFGRVHLVEGSRTGARKQRYRVGECDKMRGGCRIAEYPIL